jgi:5-methylcytosine-specific restriction protein A
MLCKVHHRLLYADSGWTVRIRDGLPELIPPVWIDPRQAPRRKPLPHLVS